MTYTYVKRADGQGMIVMEKGLAISRGIAIGVKHEVLELA